VVVGIVVVVVIVVEVIVVEVIVVVGAMVEFVRSLGSDVVADPSEEHAPAHRRRHTPAMRLRTTSTPPRESSHAHIEK
jgi:hypothetical protein